MVVCKGGTKEGPSSSPFLLKPATGEKNRCTVKFFAGLYGRSLHIGPGGLTLSLQTIYLPSEVYGMEGRSSVKTESS